MNKKNLFINGLLLLFSAAFSFLALEQSYRFYLFGNASFSVGKMNSINGLGELGLVMPSNNPVLVWELKPNLNTLHKLVSLRTNAAGLRDKEYSLTKTENIFRVAVIGDSFVMADGIEIEETFHSVLEEQLNKEQRDFTYQFINFGVSGYSLNQYMEVIKYKAQDYDPDLILIGFCPRNDQYDPGEQQFWEVSKTYPFFHFYSIDAIKGKYYYNKKDLEKELARKAPFTGQERRYMSSIFSEMSDYSKQKDIPIIVIYLDNFYNEKYANKLEEIVLKNDLYFVNVSLPFKGQDIEEYSIYPIDSHPNGEAHQIMADVLYDYLILGNDENIDFLSRGDE